MTVELPEPEVILPVPSRYCPTGRHTDRQHVWRNSPEHIWRIWTCAEIDAIAARVATGDDPARPRWMSREWRARYSWWSGKPTIERTA